MSFFSQIKASRMASRHWVQDEFWQSFDTIQSPLTDQIIHSPLVQQLVIVVEFQQFHVATLQIFHCISFLPQQSPVDDLQVVVPIWFVDPHAVG